MTDDTEQLKMTVDSFESRVAEIVETTLAENAVPFWHQGCDGSCEAVALWRSHIATIVAAKVVEEATKTEREYIESQEFYDLAQLYRHAPAMNQAKVVAAYDELKDVVLAALGGKRS